MFNFTIVIELLTILSQSIDTINFGLSVKLPWGNKKKIKKDSPL